MGRGEECCIRSVSWGIAFTSRVAFWVILPLGMELCPYPALLRVSDHCHPAAPTDTAICW